MTSPPSKTIETLVEDIYDLFDPTKTHEPSEENLESFAANLKELLRTRFKDSPEFSDRPIRFSSLGRPDRQVWFEAHPLEGSKEPLLPKTYIKFLFGDIWEQLLLFLCKEAGHQVSHEQAQVELRGVTGSIDAIIDGFVVDCKSASPYGYKKFATETVVEDDPFGYVDQLAGYSNILTPNKDAYWLATEKVQGDICISKLDAKVIKYHQPDPRIEHLQEVVASDEVPPLCYEPVPDGASGNMKLPTPCSYCAHKFRCHPGVRTFLYSTGPRYLTTVKKEPNVQEIT